jgi:UDP-glucuronate 4-epimerase
MTGGAGFIGSHLVDSLLTDGWNVTVVDNFDSFYDPAVKEANLKTASTHHDCEVVHADICDFEQLRERLSDSYNVIVHLAARAGVRPSIHDPALYYRVNVAGTQNMLEFARLRQVPQFVFASSSSVYGVNKNVPWCEDDHVLLPISPYASTKVSGELLGHVYSHLFGIRFIGLRLFTVYGPRQRPDLAIHKFTRLLLDGKPIQMFGDGSTRRDYTYVADIIAGVRSAMQYTATPYEIINLGHHRTVSLSELIATLQDVLGIRANIEQVPEQPGDVSVTYANISKARALLNYNPVTEFRSGIQNFAEWLKMQGVVTAQAIDSVRKPVNGSDTLAGLLQGPA